MYYPWELYAATFVQLLPVVGGLLHGGNLPAARRWFMLWCLLSFIADGVQFVFGQVMGQNLWLRLIVGPVQVAVAFWALSLWQLDPRPRKAMRQAIVFLIPATLLIALVWEGPASFGDKSGPMLQLSLLAACVYTLVSRSLVSSSGRLAREDWFWVTLGLSLYFALGVALGPVAMALLQGNTDFLKQVLLFKARADILAFVLMTIGMLCPLPRNLSLKPT